MPELGTPGSAGAAGGQLLAATRHRSQMCSDGDEDAAQPVSHGILAGVMIAGITVAYREAPAHSPEAVGGEDEKYDLAVL